MTESSFSDVVVVKGAGDLATGVIAVLRRAGYRVVATEVAEPTCIRRTVSFAEALFDGEAVVEGIRAVPASGAAEALRLLDEGVVPVIPDPACRTAAELRPHIIVDAILAKRNLGTRLSDAPLVIALGPGFAAGRDCHYVVETQRGHDLGRIIEKGGAAPDTGVPGLIAGVGKERVVHSPADGVFVEVRRIGDSVQAGETVARVALDGGGSAPVLANIAGCLRGLLHGGLRVFRGMKVADVDPRDIDSYCFSISDKARALGGAVLQLVCAFGNAGLPQPSPAAGSGPAGQAPASNLT